MKKTVIAIKMSQSFHIKEKPKPFIIMALVILINHVAGTILDTHCKATGIFSRGNMSPDRITVGNIKPIREIIIAICCVFEIVDIIKPKPKDAKI